MYRTYRYAILGMALAHLFDVKDPQDLLRGLSTALNDAREHLESCVASLRADKEPCADDAATPVPGADGTLGDVFTDTSSSPSHPNPTLEAYDRFRRELGFPSLMSYNVPLIQR